MRSISFKTTEKKQHPISFVGKYEVAVLTDKRIILPSGVIQQLKTYNVESVFVGRLPKSKALVLCPENLWGRWINKIKKSFPCLRTHNGARSFLVPWQPVHWDNKGRITLPRRAREYAGIKADDTVIIMGMDYRFELWSEREFNDRVRECEATLRKSVRPLSSIENIVPPSNDRKSH